MNEKLLHRNYFGSREQTKSIPLKRPTLEGRALYSKGRKLSLVCRYHTVLKAPCYFFCVVLKTPLLMYNLSFSFKKKKIQECANLLDYLLVFGGLWGYFLYRCCFLHLLCVWWLPKKSVLFRFEIAHVSWVIVQLLAPKEAVCLSRDVQDPLKNEEVQQNHTVVARCT